MARIPPVDESSAPPASRSLASEHLATGGRMTNMKWTLAHSPVALDALLQWYPLHDELVPVLGERRVWLFCHAISTQSDCLICSTFFRRLLIDAGEEPDELALDEFDEMIVDLGRRLVVDPHSVDDALYSRAVRALDAAADRLADGVRGDDGRHQRLQRRDGRRARPLPDPLRRMIAFVTGAAHGQGRATAQALAEDGYDIVALDVAAPLAYPPYPMGSTAELDSLRMAGRGARAARA